MNLREVVSAMDRRVATVVGGIAGMTFVVVEIARLVLAGPPPEHGTAAEIIGYATQHESLLRVLFPFVDALGAASLLVFAMVVIGQRSGGADVDWLGRIAGAGAILTFGVSLVLDGLLIAYVNVATSATADSAPALFAAAAGVESLFPYTLAMFLLPTAGLAIAGGSRSFGWAAAGIGVAFLVSAVLPALDIDVDLEGPLFLFLLIWIVASSAMLLWRPAPQVRTSAAGVAA